MKFFCTLAAVSTLCLFHTFLNFHSQVMASRREADQSKTKEAVEEVHKKLFLEKIPFYIYFNNGCDDCGGCDCVFALS
jgi:hypothetical protein